MLRGVVHDPTARRMGGVAGHAGLFSTADDLAIFAQELLSGSKILSRLTIEKMSSPQQPAWLRACADSAGISIRPFPPIAVICFRWAASGIPASQALRSGSTR